MEAFRSALSVWVDHFLLAMSPLDVLCIVAGMSLIHVCRYAGMWIYAIIALPGTFAHELAHFAVAFVLGAQPSFPSLIPTRTQRGWRLGSVAFRVGHLRALPIALAPLLGAVAARAVGVVLGGVVYAPGVMASVWLARVDRRRAVDGELAVSNGSQIGAACAERCHRARCDRHDCLDGLVTQLVPHGVAAEQYGSRKLRIMTALP
jgi:hypothetical protein